ncbi:hypothetical protein F2Q68_00009619 [Brassica cretica]|uniref:Uncharacterized protein n=1 Tax=Brassica cretica TaxID=69181 RepID=A0A8S9KYJ0_BRACR|nr:hypothetical protein F2Q68_00009619 [Brassica cretica]
MVPKVGYHSYTEDTGVEVSRTGRDQVKLAGRADSRDDRTRRRTQSRDEIIIAVDFEITVFDPNIIRDSSHQAPQPMRYPLLPTNTTNTGGDDELEIEKVMELENLDDMVMTKEDQEEVDRMVNEFNDVVMDETMMI